MSTRYVRRVMQVREPVGDERWRVAIDWQTLRSAVFGDDHDRFSRRDAASRSFTISASLIMTVRRRLPLLACVLVLGLVASACAGGFENGGGGTVETTWPTRHPIPLQASTSC